ncbi:MAG: hypothetical protein ACTHNS_04465 [Marmoricola sp.]
MGAPGWVSYAALALSAMSLAVAVLSYRAGGPRLRLEASGLSKGSEPFPNGAVAVLTVVNAGRAAVTIQGFGAKPYGSGKVVVRVGEVVGPELPYRLAAHATETWHVDALAVARKYDAGVESGRVRPASSWPSHFQFVVEAGNGKAAHDKHVWNSLRLIADAAP